jgi:hypothetical protein
MTTRTLRLYIPMPLFATMESDLRGKTAEVGSDERQENRQENQHKTSGSPVTFIAIFGESCKMVGAASTDLF